MFAKTEMYLSSCMAICKV